MGRMFGEMEVEEEMGRICGKMEEKRERRGEGRGG